MNKAMLIENRDPTRLIGEGTGICAGTNWRIVHVDSQVACFLRRPATELFGNSLMECMQELGLEKEPQFLANLAPFQDITFTAPNQSYIFRWIPLELPKTEKEKTATPSPTFSDFRIFTLCEAQSGRSLPGSINLDTRLKTLLNSVHDGIWIIDAEGITLYVNRAMRRIAGINASDVVGQHVTTPMKNGVFSTCVTLEALDKREVVTRFDDYATRKRCLNTSTPLYDDDGNVSCVVACIRDMSELEILQSKLAEAEQTARRYKEQLDWRNDSQTNIMIAESPAMHDYLNLLDRSAMVNSSVLILGETGTGKSLAANYIHNKSSRSKGPFVTVNCAAIAPTLIESELFGYEKGAFTGASVEGKKGFFQIADGGTLFLDEIGELSINMQAKLLHVLDNFSFHRVGGTRQITVDVRIVAATNRPLEKLVEAGSFREDLFYRLRVLTATIPPLRERTEDIPAMAYHFLKEACKRYGVSKYFEPKIIDHLMNYSWPGNVRELQGTIEFLAVMAEGSVIKANDLPAQIKSSLTDEEEPLQDLKTAVRELEYALVKNALLKTGSTYKAAKLLGTSQSTVVRKAQQLNIKIS